MKTLFFLLILPFIFYAQQDSTRVKENKQNGFINHMVVMEISANGQFPFSGGSQFINKIYQLRPGFGFDFRLDYHGLYGLGIEYDAFNAGIKNKALIGPFEDASFKIYSFYLFGQIRIIHKLNAEFKMGIGRTNIRHKYNDLDYSLNYNNFLLGTGLSYSLTNTNSIKVFLNYDLNFLKARANQQLPEPFKNEYSKSSLSAVKIGVKFSFW